MRKEQSMNNIDFEKDQTEVLDRTENIKSLANQVKKLRDLEDQIKADEQALKDKEYKKIELNHMLADNCAMQLLRNPKHLHNLFLKLPLLFPCL